MQQGYLELITGTMFSGKSSTLLKKLFKYSRKGQCLFIQPRIDNRNYISRNKRLDDKLNNLIQRMKVIHWVVDTLPNNDELEKWAKHIDYIFIDEGQFFSNIWQADDYANLGKQVFVSALLFTTELEWFKPLIEFYPCVDKIVWCKKGYCSSCHKHKNNLHTVYLGTKSQQIEVGGDDKYGLMCRECFHKFRKGN